jgi:hypothetical protein
MDKKEYLAETLRILEALIADPVFNNNLSQVRARAIQQELVPGHVSTDFTFSSERIRKYCDYILSESSLLLRENFGDRNLPLIWIKRPAEAFEFLAKFVEEDQKEILLISSAICYHIAGYQANARCIAQLVEQKYLSGQFEEIDTVVPDAVMTLLFRQALVSFLKRDISALRQTTRRALSSIYGFQETITSGIADHILPFTELFSLTGHAFFQQSLSDFVEYCLGGNRECFFVARQNIEKSCGYFQKAGDVMLRAELFGGVRPK